MSLPREVQDALAQLKTPCESDRINQPRYVCDEEATYYTPTGTLLCTEHALKHNASIEANRWIKDKTKYLAVPREQ